MGGGDERGGGEAGKNVKPVLPGREYSVVNQDLKDIKKKNPNAMSGIHHTSFKCLQHRRLS